MQSPPKFRQDLASQVAAKLKSRQAAENHFKKVAVAAKKAYDKAQEAYNVAFNDHAQDQELLNAIDETLAKRQANGKATTTTAAAPVRGKPGPKPGKAKSKASPVKAKGRPGPKPGKAAKKSGGKKASGKKEGGKQTFVERLIGILGTTAMSAGEVAQVLVNSGTQPASTNLSGYISTVFSTNSKTFHRVSRGRYCVAVHKAAAIAAEKAAAKSAPPKSKASPKAAKAAAKAAKAAAKAAATPAPEPEPAAAPEETRTPADQLVADVGLPAGAFSDQPTAPLS